MKPENLTEDRLNGFNEGLPIDLDKTRFITRTPPLHDPTDLLGTEGNKVNIMQIAL